MRDQAFCRRLAEKTREDLIRSRRYSYASFVGQFDEILGKHHATSQGFGRLMPGLRGFCSTR